MLCSDYRISSLPVWRTRRGWPSRARRRSCRACRGPGRRPSQDRGTGSHAWIGFEYAGGKDDGAGSDGPFLALLYDLNASHGAGARVANDLLRRGRIEDADPVPLSGLDMVLD